MRLEREEQCSYIQQYQSDIIFMETFHNLSSLKNLFRSDVES